MYVDSSAILSILLGEEDAKQVSCKIDEAKTRLSTSPISVVEATLNLARETDTPIMEAHEMVLQFLDAARIIQISMTPEMGRKALEAYATYGRGSGSKARLNLGDVFSYAAAKSLRVPLLYKGQDFVHTDLG